MSEELIKRLHDEARRAAESMKEILDRTPDNDEERAENKAAFDRASQDYDEKREQITALIKERDESAKLSAAIDAAFRAADPQPVEQRGREVAGWETELRESLNAKRPFRGGGEVAMPQELRTLLAGTAGKGKEFVPTDLAGELYQVLFTDGALLSAGPRVITTDGGNPINFPRVSARGGALDPSGAGIAAMRRTEGGTITVNAGPSTDQVTFNAYGYGEIQQVSREALEDSQFDLQALIAQVLGQNLANSLDYDFTNGTGTNQPRGLLTVIGTNVLQSTTNGKHVPQSFDDILDLEGKLDPRVRRNAKFITTDTVVTSLRKLKVKVDGSADSNNYAWQPAPTAGAPDSLDGHPLIVDPYMPAPGVNKICMAFVDMSKFYVRMVGNVRVEWSTEYAWASDLVSVKAVVRADADSIDDTAFTGYKGAAA